MPQNVSTDPNLNPSLGASSGSSRAQGQVQAPSQPQGQVSGQASGQVPGQPQGQAPGQQRRVIDDEQMKRMMGANRRGVLERNRFRLVTLALIAINVVVFLVEAVLSGMQVDISARVLVNMGAMYAPYVTSPLDLYRFVTPMFLHMDLMHLLFNMVALYSVGEVLERVLGRGSFILLYFVAGITGNAVSYAADVFVTGGTTVSAGASTSVFGLFIAVALLAVLHRGDRRFFTQYSKGMLGIIAVNVAYTFLVPGISVAGHLGGALGGLIAMFMVPSKNLRVPAAVRVVVAIAWVAALVALLAYTGVLAL